MDCITWILHTLLNNILFIKHTIIFLTNIFLHLIHN